MREQIRAAWENRALLKDDAYAGAVHGMIDMLDKGEVRVAYPKNGDWEVDLDAKKAVLMYFAVADMATIELEPFEFFDKIPLKKKYMEAGVRVVPPGAARYGAHLGRNVVLMPGYVNIGAYVDENTMVDTHATVGSCAQIGKRVHLAGAVRIGGVLEPPQGRPVIIEDDVFCGSAVSVMEGVHVKKGAILGAGVMLTASTRIIDVTGPEPVVHKSVVPENAVVIPGTYAKQFPAGEFNVQCALIIGQRGDRQDQKVSLNDALREFNVSV